MLLNLRNWSLDEHDKNNKNEIFSGIGRTSRAGGVLVTQEIWRTMGYDRIDRGQMRLQSANTRQLN